MSLKVKKGMRLAILLDSGITLTQKSQNVFNLSERLSVILTGCAIYQASFNKFKDKQQREISGIKWIRTDLISSYQAKSICGASNSDDSLTCVCSLDLILTLIKGI